MTFPPIGVTAVIAGMSIFNRDAAVVESRLLRINAVSNQLERETGGAFAGALGAFGSMATQIATGATVIAGGLALAGGAAIKFAADFQQGLALTGALTGATSAQLEQLTGVITDLSRHGTLGMEDLATAATDLARSGVPIEAVMGGALKAVQDLTIASGGELGLENAAKLTATAMQAFGISVEDITKVTTAATVVAQNSALTFTDFKTAVATAGAPFASVGFTIKDLAVAEALLGRNAFSGSQSATALRNIIQRLEKPSKDAAAVMQKYGIHLFDASGNAVTLRELLGQLNTAFGEQALTEGKLTEQQRDQALATLFLQRAGAAALVLTREGVKGYDELRASFDKLNASDIVDALLKPLNAQVKIAANNVVALGIAFGSQFLPPLQDATAGLVKFLQAIPTDAAVNFGRNVVEGIGAVGGAVQAAIGGIQAFLAAFGLTDAAGQLLKSTLVGLAVIVATILGSAIAGTVAAWGGFLLAVGLATVAASKIDDVIKNLGYSFANWLSQFGPLGVGIANLVRSASDGFGALAALFRGDLDTAISDANQSFYGFASTIRTNGGEALQFMQDRLKDAGQAFAPWAAGAGAAGQAVADSLSGTSAAIQALQFLLQGNLPAAAQAAELAITHFSAVLADIGKFVNDTLVPAFESAISNLGIIGNLTNIASSVSSAFGSVLTIVSNVANGIGALLQILIRLVQGFSSAQQGGSALTLVIEALLVPFKVLLTVHELLWAAIDRVLGAVANASVQFNDWAQSANDAAPSITGFQTAIQDLGNTIGPVMAEAGQSVQSALQTIQDALNTLAIEWPTVWTNVSNTTVTAVDAVGAALQQLPGIVSAAIDFVVNDVSQTWQAVLDITNAVWSLIPANIRDNLTQIASDVGSILSGLPVLVQAIFVTMSSAIFEELSKDLEFEKLVFQGMVALAQTLMQALVDNVINILGTLSSLVQSPLAQFFVQIETTLLSLAARGLALGAQIAGNIISGLVGGITAGVANVTGAIRGLMNSAVAAAQAAIAAHSPSRVFAEIGGDVDEGVVVGIEEGLPDVSAAGSDAGMALAQGMIDALDAMKAPVRGSAAALVDQAINALSDIGNRAGQLMADTESKMAAVGEAAGRKINEAIKAAADQIEQTIADAQSRIYDLQASLGQSRADRGARDALRDSQDARRAARRNAQEDADAAASHAKDISDADFKRSQDIAKAKAKAEQDLSQATTDKQRAAIAARLEDELAAADVSYKQELDRINRAFAASEADRAARRQRQQEDADFEAKLSQETQDLNDKLENEALQRSIDRTIQERDARIDSINKALTAKETKIKEEAAREVENLRDNVERRLRILEDEFAKKAADLLRKGGENMRPLVENIQQILSGNFDAMRQSALDFANSVGQAINALKELEAARRRAEFSAPNLPDPTKGLDAVPDVPDQFENVPLPEFGRGGVVQGPLGQPQLAIVHGGEFVASLDSAAARIARMMQGPAAPSGTSIYNYNVNASYADTQSPASVEMDMRALILMARG